MNPAAANQIQVGMTDHHLIRSSYAVKTLWPFTTTETAGRGRVAGPWITAPVCALNSLPWHGQVITPFWIDPTVQPWWVHMADSPCTVPPSPRTSTTLS